MVAEHKIYLFSLHFPRKRLLSTTSNPGLVRSQKTDCAEAFRLFPEVPESQGNPYKVEPVQTMNLELTLGLLLS